MKIYRMFAACSLLAIALGSLSSCGENAENPKTDADAGVADSGGDAAADAGADAGGEADAAIPAPECDADERVTGGACAACPPGTSNEAGDDTAGDDTACDAISCDADEHVAGNACVACPAGTTNMAGDDASAADTPCDGVMCPSNQHVEANACVPCAPGTANEAGDDASGADTACDPILCAENEHVVANTCVACPEGTENSAGDDAAGNDTECDPIVWDVLATALGDMHSCALIEGGSVKCWGNNDSGQLGIDDGISRGDDPGEMGMNLPVVDLGTGRTAVALDAGPGHTCAILDDETVKCWGYNFSAALGLGDTAHHGDDPGEMGDALPVVDLGTGRTAVAIAAGEHSCAILDDGSVKCWGLSWQGSLGLGDESARGSQPGQMGDALPAVDLGAGRTAVTIASGRYHTCTILDDASTKCWGSNNRGQLGLGDVYHRGDAPGEMGDALPALDLGTGRTATALALGDQHTCALLDDASVKCWGGNDQGQLGRGDTDAIGDSPGEMGDALVAIDLGTGRTALAIAAGSAHTCAALDDGSLKCWGNSFSGQLGLGDDETRGNEPGEMGDALPALDLGPGRTVTAVATTYAHTCAIFDDGTAKCWGVNESGQLGIGDTDNRGDDPNEMGNFLPVIDLGP